MSSSLSSWPPSPGLPHVLLLTGPFLGCQILCRTCPKCFPRENHSHQSPCFLPLIFSASLSAVEMKGCLALLETAQDQRRLHCLQPAQSTGSWDKLISVVPQPFHPYRFKEAFISASGTELISPKSKSLYSSPEEAAQPEQEQSHHQMSLDLPCRTAWVLP